MSIVLGILGCSWRESGASESKTKQNLHSAATIRVGSASRPRTAPQALEKIAPVARAARSWPSGQRILAVRRTLVFAVCVLLLSTCPSAYAARGTSAEWTPGCGISVTKSGEVDWAALGVEVWVAVQRRSMSQDVATRLSELQDTQLIIECPQVAVAAAAALVAHLTSVGTLDVRLALQSYVSPLQLGISVFELVNVGSPLFGALDWLASEVSAAQPPREAQLEATGCNDLGSLEFRKLLGYHFSAGASPMVPMLPALEYISGSRQSAECAVGRAAAFLSLASPLAEGKDSTEDDIAGDGSEQSSTSNSDLKTLLGRAEQMMRDVAADTEVEELFLFGGAPDGWYVWPLLHRLAESSEPLQSRRPSPPEVGGCLMLIYAFPTTEIRTDTAQALSDLEQCYVKPLGVQHRLIVFTDAATADGLQNEFHSFTSLQVVPAVIPEEQLRRPMNSYTCVDGHDCASGLEPPNESGVGHRGVINGAQFWSPNYLRISRYTAGPLFFHPALDQCGAFLKIDTDFFFTSTLQTDPIEEIAREGAMLAYWQIHVQGQRQMGYMDAAVTYLKEQDLRIRNPAFYARGRFEEKAAKLGIDVNEVPEALQAATVIYGCLFGGHLSFFRSPMYQDFFKYMDQKQGFEQYGWSNQFFLGTAAAALMWPSQVRRLYLSGRHQESRLDVSNGTVTEFLNGSSRNIFR